jgi:hypothetical protein
MDTGGSNMRQGLITQIDGDHWVLLTQESTGSWSFLLWGHYPISENLGQMSEHAAKKLALAPAKKHLRECGLQIEPRNGVDNPWKVAVRYIAA